MRVLFLPKNVDASGWYRCLFPASYLSERGHFAQAPPMSFRRPDGSPAELVGGQLPEGWIVANYGPWPEADVYVLQMTNDPAFVAHAEVTLDDGGLRPELKPGFVEQLQQQGKKVVVEIDDDLLHVPAYNPFDDNPKWVHRLIEEADAVQVSTESLRRSYEKLNKNVTVLRNRLHWAMWNEIPPVYERNDWRRFRVGWMGILEYHKADLDVLKPWLREWLLLHPDVEFVSCGGADVHDYLNIPEPQRVTTDRTDFRHLELAYITSVMDVGLVPLAENRFNEGKSYLKGLEYSACGIVPLATPTEQYRELITHRDNGYLCKYSGQWLKALNELHDDRDRLRTMGEAARANAQQNTYINHIGEWESFYQQLADLVEARKTLWTPAAA